jgi:hypothetical protein
MRVRVVDVLTGDRRSSAIHNSPPRPAEARPLRQILAPHPIGKSDQPSNNITFVRTKVFSFSGCSRDCSEFWPAQVEVSHVPRRCQRFSDEAVIWFMDKLRHGSEDSLASEFRRVSKA